MHRSIFAALIAGTALTAGACDSPSLAFGDVNSIIVGATPELWSQVADTVADALQPTIMTTVEEEEVFQVTHRDPADTLWADFRRFRQLLLLGTPADPWIAEALDDAEESVSAPGLTHASDVWARGQTATVVVLPEQDPAAALVRLLPDLRNDYLERYRRWSHSQMFVTGADSALADTLMTTAGFSLLVPRVYEWARSDSIFIFRNDNPDPSELIRQFTVTWMSPPPDTLTVDDLLARRDELSQANYEPAQLSDTTLFREVGNFTIDGRDARRIQAVWTNPPEADWPAAGTFILQTVSCPEQDRLYLIDAWLYAPGRDKFEYLYQLETILDGFRCGSA